MAKSNRMRNITKEKKKWLNMTSLHCTLDTQRRLHKCQNLFTSHEFILRLAQNNQAEYVEALHTYRNSTHGNIAAPFKAVHAVLSNSLYNHSSLVSYIGNVASVDIFGQPNGCANWQRIIL